MSVIKPINEEAYQKILLSGGSFWGTGALKRELDALSSYQLKFVLDRLVEGEKDFLKLFDRLSEVIPMDKFQEAIRKDYPDYVDALHAAKEMFEKAKYQVAHSQTTIPLTVGARLESLLDKVILGFENVLCSFGVAEFFSLSENVTDVKWKTQIGLMLLNLFSLLTALILPLSSASLAGMIIAGVLLGISVLSLIYPSVRPMPSVLPKAENWTQLYWHSELPIGEGRQETVDELAKTLITSKHFKVHPMLVGPSGVGKTETIKMLVAAIERGEYPELKDKKVFYINTADLIGAKDVHHGDSRMLNKIQNLMGRHRDRFILIFDEMHMSCEKIGDSVMAEQMKALLDTKFPYVIGLTTERDFYRSIYKNNPAFARRFKLINVENTDEVATVQVLNNVLLRKAPGVLVNEGASRMIYQKSIEAFGSQAQPATALDVLSQCLKKTGEMHKSPLEAHAHRLREELSSLQSEEIFNRGAHKAKTEELQQRLRHLELRIQEEKRGMDDLLHQKDRWLFAKAQAQKLALRVEKASQKEIKQLMLLNYILIPHLEKTIREEAKRFGIKTVLSEELIDETIQEMLAHQRKVQTLISG